MQRRPDTNPKPNDASASGPSSLVPPGTSSDPVLTQAAVLAERLATFLKACFIYPDNNQRVRVTSELVLESLREAFTRRPVVEIVVGSHDLVVSGSRLPLRSHAQVWLRDLFVKALVGGVEFSPAVDAQSMTAAARRLQQAQTGKERGLGVWSDPIAGIRARELFMSGSHSETESESDSADDPDMMTGSQSARSRALESALAASSRVRESLDALRALLPTQGAEEGSAAVIDVIRELVQCLPAEASYDHAYAESLAQKILAAAQTELGRLAGGASIRRDDLATTFLSVGKKMFTATMGGAVAPPSAGRGHGDETVADSLEALIEDLNKLEIDEQSARGIEDWTLELKELQAAPAAPAASAETDTARRDKLGEAAAVESIGIVLHVLTHDGEMREPAVRHHLLVALRSGGDRVRALLSDYMAAALVGDDADQRTSWRLIRLVGDPSVVTALHAAKLLEPDLVVAQFPKTLHMFLDTLDDAEGSQKVARLGRLLDEAALASAAGWFERHSDVLSEARVERLFKSMSARALPLAALCLRHAKVDCKTAAAKFLRQCGLSGPASVAVRVVDPASRLPRGYLEELCEQVASGRPAREELTAMSGSLTRSFIQELAGDSEQEARRVFAIQALRELPTSETRVLLNDLISATRGFFLKRESRNVRRAARETVAALVRKRG